MRTPVVVIVVLTQLDLLYPVLGSDWLNCDLNITQKPDHLFNRVKYCKKLNRTLCKLEYREEVGQIYKLTGARVYGCTIDAADDADEDVAALAAADVDATDGYDDVDDDEDDAAATALAAADATNVDATDVDATDVDATDVDATDVDANDVDATDVDATDVDATDVDATGVDATDVDATDVDDEDEDADEDDACSRPNLGSWRCGARDDGHLLCCWAGLIPTGTTNIVVQKPFKAPGPAAPGPAAPGPAAPGPAAPGPAAPGPAAPGPADPPYGLPYTDTHDDHVQSRLLNAGNKRVTNAPFILTMCVMVSQVMCKHLL